MLHKNLSAQCLDADGSYLHAAGTAGGSGLQFIKAGTLRATFYLRPIAFLFSHRKSLKIHYVILTGEIAISNHLYALLLPFFVVVVVVCLEYLLLHKMLWKILTKYTLTNTMKCLNKKYNEYTAQC